MNFKKNALFFCLFATMGLLSCGDSGTSAASDESSSSRFIESSSSAVSSSSSDPLSSSAKVSSSSSDIPGSSAISSSSIASSSSIVYSSSAVSSSSNGLTIVQDSSGWCAVYGNCGVFVDERDNATYKWTKIGDQVWMAENLAYLPSVNAMNDYSTTVAKFYVYYYDGTDVSSAKTSSFFSNYGVLYNWAAVMNGSASSAALSGEVQGICPSGWHVPDNADWQTLMDEVGGIDVAGTALKANSSLWITNRGKDTYGFYALPGGYYNNNESDFFEVLGLGYWWSATESSDTEAYRRVLYDNQSKMTTGSASKAFGFSLRCVGNE
ncbi:MAG: FISUMP domain-containing protein [Fibrobacteraceae bacterium]